MTEHIEFTVNIKIPDIEALIDRLVGKITEGDRKPEAVSQKHRKPRTVKSAQPEPAQPEPAQPEPAQPEPAPPEPETQKIASNAEELNALNQLLSELGYNLTSPFFREADENFRRNYPNHPLDQDYRDYIRDFLTDKPKLDVPTNWERELGVFKVKRVEGKSRAEARRMGDGDLFLTRIKNFFLEKGLAYLLEKHTEAEYQNYLAAMELEGKNPKGLLEEALTYAGSFN